MFFQEEEKKIFFWNPIYLAPYLGNCTTAQGSYNSHHALTSRQKVLGATPTNSVVFRQKLSFFFPLMWQEIIVSIYWGSCAVGLRAAKMCQPELFNSSMVYWINERMRNTVKGNLGPREHLSANATGLDNPGLQLETVFHKAVPPTVIHVRQTHKTGFRLPTGSAWSGHSNPQPEEPFQTPSSRRGCTSGYRTVMLQTQSCLQLCADPW